jgi:hypothetical protein
MNKILLLLFQLLIVMMSLYCSKSGDGRFKGKIIYSSATNHLYELNLDKSKKEKIIYANDNIDCIKYIERVPANCLILSVHNPLNAPILKLLNLSNNEVRTLGEGASPTYIAKHDVVFYYVQDKPFGAYGRMHLYMGKLDKLSNSEFICDLPKPDSTCYNLIRTPAIQVSPDKIVFHGINNTIIEYDYLKNNLSEVNLKNLWPIGWREKTGELICSGPKGKHFFLINWSNKSMQTIDLGDDSMGWTYIKEYDILLFSKERLETGDIYFYDFGTSNVEKLISNSIIRDNAVYLPEEVIK